LTLLTGTDDVIYGLWNTVLLGNATLSTVGSRAGNYYFNEVPQYALDQNTITKYSNFGDCFRGQYADGCGTKTGFYVILNRRATLVKAVQFTTAFDLPARDPLSITIEGSNAHFSALMRGKSWSLIGTLSTGLDEDPGRETDGLLQCLPTNTISYTSYRILITSVRGAGDSVQYSEVKLFGYEHSNEGNISSTFRFKQSYSSIIH
jgi:hypothetical protein